MGISLVAYLCEVEKLRQVFDAKDANLEKKLLATLEDDVKWDDVEVRRALHDCVFGISQSVQPSGEYAAALEVLCIYFGEQLEGDAFDSMQPAATSLLVDFDGLLNDAIIPLPIPIAQTGGFPAVCYINSGEARRILASLIEPQLNLDDPLGQEWIAEAFQTYRQWLTRVSESNSDLFIFLY